MYHKLILNRCFSPQNVKKHRTISTSNHIIIKILLQFHKKIHKIRAKVLLYELHCPDFFIPYFVQVAQKELTNI